MKLPLKELRTLIQGLLGESPKPDAGPFKTGDEIHFGKYKNKKGKIKRIFNDEKDHVSIEIEPDPKGRKKNVEMGLYKVWPREENKNEE